MFVGFAGDLVVGVWVGRDDDTSLGKVVGGTVPAEIWRSFMSSALSIDHSPGPRLPVSFQRQQQEHSQSPLPPEWSDATKPLREIARHLRDLLGDDRR